MKFLVVDDHELIREAMRRALEQLDSNAAILEAADSRQAMLLIEENNGLDLILLDLNLPDRDGFSVLVELRKSYPSVAVVVMSAQQDHDSVVKALNLGALGFIPKSATRKVILGALQLVMSGGIYIPPQALPSEHPPLTPDNLAHCHVAIIASPTITWFGIGVDRTSHRGRHLRRGGRFAGRSLSSWRADPRQA